MSSRVRKKLNRRPRHLRLNLTSPTQETMDDFDRESLTIPSFAELYCADAAIEQALRLYIGSFEEDNHQGILTAWADKSRPVLDRLNAVVAHFEDVHDRLEDAHAEVFVHNRRITKGPETFSDVRIAFCDKYRGGDFSPENSWALLNYATKGAGEEYDEALEAAEDRWAPGVAPLMTYHINPKCPSSETIQLLEDTLAYIMTRADVLVREARRLITYGH
jgi:hypothetical protein